MILLFILFAIQQCHATVPVECRDKQIANVTIDVGAIEKAIKHINQLKELHDHRLQERHLNTFHLFMQPLSRFFNLEDSLYIISNEPSADAYMAFGVCGFYGGYLLQVDHHTELGEIKNNVVNLDEIKCVWLGIVDPLMTDEWIYPLTKLPAFNSFDATQTYKKQCAALDRPLNFNMRKIICSSACHFICEIPGGA